MELAFERHATSKIRSADDLNTVTSMGFRGEALASIAAISRVELVSKTADQQNGYKVVLEGGNVLEKSIAGSPTGTSITVTNLFYNTPVRYKFLKKDFTEAGYIEDAITRTALVHPEIAIKLINSGKTVIQTNGNGDLKTVIYSIYGKDVANALIETDYTYEDIHITGVVGKPEIARSNRAYQMFFVNKRYIKDKALSSATERAYKGMLPMGKFGFLVLNIEMNPSKVDVNVHPAKLEVRFEDENLIFKAVYHAIKDSLLKIDEPSSNNNSDQISIGTPTIEIKPFNKTDNFSVGSKETIVEQIFKARQLAEQHNQEQGQPQQSQKVEKIEIPEIEKSQEVLKKLQEMKQKLIQETPGLKLENKEVIQPIQVEQPQQEENEKVELPQQEGKKKIEVQQETIEIEKPEILKNQEEPQILEEELPKALQHEEIEQPAEEIKYEIESEPIKEEKVAEKSVEYTKEFEEMYMQLFGTKPVKGEKYESKIDDSNKIDDIAKLENRTVFENIEEYQKPTYKFVGILFDEYIIIEMEKEMYIIDQHSAHEKILFEKLKDNYYDIENKDSQLMLLPDIITLSRKQMEIARDNMQMFRNAGFMVEEFGENTVKITGVPEICLELETREIFTQILDEIDKVSRNEKQEVEQKFISTLAFKIAKDASIANTKEEVDGLMNELLILNNPFTGPLGEPIAIKMSKYDIERKFARK